MKKRIAAAAVILLTLTAILYFVPVKFCIGKTMTAQVYDNIKSETAGQTTVTLDGTYTFYLFRPDNFTGSLKIEAYPETAGKDVDLRISASPDSLIYRSWSGSRLNSEMFGVISAAFSMNGMVILKSDAAGAIDLSGENTCVILCGDAEKEDAYKLLESLKQ